MNTRVLSIILILSISTSLCVFCSCSNEVGIMEYDSDRYIDLYDYSTVEIPYDYTQITKEDIRAIIEAELSVNEAYIEIRDRDSIEQDDIVLISVDSISEFYFVGSTAYTLEFDQEITHMKKGDTKRLKTTSSTFSDVEVLGIYRTASFNDTDFVLSYYNYSSLNELELYIRERASEEIIYNFIFDQIYQHSVLIGFPPEIDKLMENSMQNYIYEILKEYPTLEDYLHEIDMTRDDFNESFYSRYYEMMLYKAILDKENVSISAEDIEAYAQETPTDYNAYDIYAELAIDAVRTILTDKAIIVN